jgi:hypothetical protein
VVRQVAYLCKQKTNILDAIYIGRMVRGFATWGWMRLSLVLAPILKILPMGRVRLSRSSPITCDLC